MTMNAEEVLAAWDRLVEFCLGPVEEGSQIHRDAIEARAAVEQMAKDAERCERAKTLAQKWRTHEVGETCEANVGYNRALKHCAIELEAALQESAK